MKPIKMWALIRKEGDLSYPFYETRAQARNVNRIWFRGTATVIRVEIREVNRAK